MRKTRKRKVSQGTYGIDIKKSSVSVTKTGSDISSKVKYNK